MTQAKPKELRLVDGTGPGRDKHGMKVEPAPPFRRIAPEPPDWFNDDDHEEALEEWNRIVPELSRLDLLKGIDVSALVTYCTTWQRYKHATINTERDGYTVVGAHGGVIRNPEVGIAIEASRELRQWCLLFGLTPVGEAKVASPKLPDGDDDDD